MPAGSKSISIDKYVIFYFACGDEVDHISCFSGGSFAGFISFYPKGQIPASSMAGNHFWLNYEIDKCRDIIELLRYEKPISVGLFWNASNVITKGFLTTSQEPIGEQEGPGRAA